MTYVWEFYFRDREYLNGRNYPSILRTRHNLTPWPNKRLVKGLLVKRVSELVAVSDKKKSKDQEWWSTQTTGTIFVVYSSFDMRSRFLFFIKPLDYTLIGNPYLLGKTS